MLVVGGSTVNLMPYIIYKKIGKTYDDLTKTNTMLNIFTRDSTEAKGVLMAEITMRSKTLLTTFFIVDVQVNYNVLLGKD